MLLESIGHFSNNLMWSSEILSHLGATKSEWFRVIYKKIKNRSLSIKYKSPRGKYLEQSKPFEISEKLIF